MLKFSKIINISLIMFFIAFSTLFCMNKFNKIPFIYGENKNIVVYEVWHIESFEGGSGSRSSYLKQLALNYEKAHPSTLFMIKTINDADLNQLLEKSTPHIVSFSEQTATTLLPYLSAFQSEYDVRNNLLDSAYFNGKLMAIPYIASGYCYFEKVNSSINSPLYTANNSCHSAEPILNSININEGQTLSSYECYSKFVNSTDIKLLGTARDLYRIKRLENLGRLNCSYSPVDNFSDLIQYLGILNSNQDILNFIDYIMNNENQIKLSQIGLFSTKYLTLYTEPTYIKMENALNTCFVPNIFN